MGSMMEISGGAITPKMKEIRSLPLKDRLTFYIEHRLSDQQTWYKKKSTVNKMSRNSFFVYLIIVQFLTLLITFFRIGFQNVTDLTPILASIAIALLAWIQIKKFNELSVAYNLTAHELNLVKARKDSIVDEASFADFVSDAENAISREHTMWAARRDNI